jgi:hypothetical protein
MALSVVSLHQRLPVFSCGIFVLQGQDRPGQWTNKVALLSRGGAFKKRQRSVRRLEL